MLRNSEEKTKTTDLYLFIYLFIDTIRIGTCGLASMQALKSKTMVVITIVRTVHLVLLLVNQLSINYNITLMLKKLASNIS